MKHEGSVVMSDCQRIESLVTPFIDGELADGDHAIVARHLRGCAACASRAAAERAVRDLIHQVRPGLLHAPRAPEALRAKCAKLAGGSSRGRRAFLRAFSLPLSWRTRLAPIALAASLVAIVGAAFTYQLTAKSARIMAAELTADHVKCFALNGVLRTEHEAALVESAMISGFDWRMHVPEDAEHAGLELVGARPCLYGEGKIAHIMYRHHGHPVSLFMLPNASRSRELVRVLGHEAVIWCVGKRTFVLLAREPRAELERMAAFVQGGLE
jgi:anti-sigma factor RsiW